MWLYCPKISLLFSLPTLHVLGETLKENLIENFAVRVHSEEHFMRVCHSCNSLIGQPYPDSHFILKPGTCRPITWQLPQNHVLRRTSELRSEQISFWGRIEIRYDDVKIRIYLGIRF